MLLPTHQQRGVQSPSTFVLYSKSVKPTTTTTTELFDARLPLFFVANSCQTLAVDIMADVERDCGAAKRRRERRLRSWLKHERQTVLTDEKSFPDPNPQNLESVFFTPLANRVEGLSSVF